MDLVRALKEVPEVRLRLLELARGLVKEDGSLDMERAAFLGKELEEAIGEAKGYAQATQEMVSCLKQMARS